MNWRDQLARDEAGRSLFITGVEIVNDELDAAYLENTGGPRDGEFVRDVWSEGGRGMKVYVVIDHVCEADIVRGVFSTKTKARAFIKENKNKPFPQSMEGPYIEEWSVDE